MRTLKDECGNVLILTALSMSMLLSFLAMAVDVGNLFYTQRQLQTLADAAAMAGAQAASLCATNSPNCGAVQTAAKSALAENLSATETSTLFTNCASASGTGLLLTVNNGPCALAGDPNSGQTTYVEAVVSKNVPTFFARIFGVKTLQVSARAEAGKAAPSGGSKVWASKVDLNGGKIADASGENGGVYADAYAFADGGNISAPYTLNSSGTITGNCYNNGTSCGSPPTRVTAEPEPFSDLNAKEPAKPANSTTNSTTVNGATTLQPGAYTDLSFNGSGYTVNFKPGLYYFTGAVQGSDVTLSGKGVTFFFAGNGSFTTNSGEVWDLDPPSAADIAADTTNAYNGCTSCADMSIWQSTSDSSLMTLDAGYAMSITGNIYAPSAEIRMNGNGSITTTMQIVCNQLTLDAGTLTIDSSNGVNNGPKTVALVE